MTFDAEQWIVETRLRLTAEPESKEAQQETRKVSLYESAAKYQKESVLWYLGKTDVEPAKLNLAGLELDLSILQIHSFSDVYMHRTEVRRSRPISNWDKLSTVQNRLSARAAYFVGCEFVQTNFKWCNFTETTFTRCRFDGCTFRWCDFDEAHFSEGGLVECSFHHSNLDRSTFDVSDVAGVSFRNCSMDSMWFEKSG